MNETETRRRPGGRSARVRRAVLDATLDLVHERGLDALTVAEAAARAGVHETSIYRRWGTRENLMIDALLGDAEERLPVPDTGTLRADLITYAAALARYLSTPAGIALDRALASASDDPATRRLRDQYWDARIALSGQIVERAIQRGELPETTDPRFVLQLLVAPLHFKVVLTREPLTPDLPERLVDAVLHGLAATVEGSSAADVDPLADARPCRG